MGTPTWLSAVPAALAAAFWVIGPGLLVTRTAGVRGVSAWGAAPLVSVALIATSAALGTAVGITWDPWVPLLAAVLVAVSAGLSRGLLARRPAGSSLHRGWRPALRTWEPGRRLRTALVRLRTPRGTFARGPEPVTTALPGVWRTSAQRAGVDGRRAGVAALVGTVLAGALSWLTVVRGFGPVDQMSSTYDAVFHYSGVAHVLDTGDGSSLTLGTLTNPGAATAFYPGAWHDLVSLVATTSGTGVPVATNLTAWSVAGLVFPLSSLFLSRHVLGRSAGAAFAAPLLATAFTGFPWMLMAFGVLWPNLLGLALLPAALTVVAVLSGTAREPVLRPAGALALAVAAVLALGFAHPNAVFSLAVLGLFPVLWAAARLVRRRLLTSRFWQPVLAVAALTVLVTTVWWLMTASSLTEGVRGVDWPAFTDTPGAVADVLWNATNGRPRLIVLSVLVIVGAVAALRRVTTSWLVPAHLASGWLYVLAASSEGELSAALTGAWYNDSYRLAAMVPVTGVPLVVLGLVTVAGLLRSALRRLPRAAPVLRRRGAPAAVVVALTAVAFATTGGLYVSTHASVLAGPYQEPADVLLGPGQRAFLEEVGRIVPEGQVVATDPYTGNALLYPLTGREVLFPHLVGSWTPEQTVVATRLRDAATDPAVCEAAAATRVGWLLSGPITFWPWHGGASWYPGLHATGAMPGFELVASGGGQELWRLTACDPDTPDGPDVQAMDPGAPPVPVPRP